MRSTHRNRFNQPPGSLLSDSHNQNVIRQLAQNLECFAVHPNNPNGYQGHHGNEEVAKSREQDDDELLL